MADKEWYGAKTIYSHVTNQNEITEYNLYEERVVVLRATSFDDAIIQAEKEANEYADEEIGIKYLNFVNVFKLAEDKIANKTEVYSLMRDSKLDKENYLDNFFDTGFERTKH